MRSRPGPKCMLLGLTGVGIGLISFVWPVAAWLVLPLIAAGLTGAFLDYRETGRALTGLDVSREAPERAARNAECRIELTITNKSSIAAAGTFRDVLPSVSEPNWHEQPFAVDADSDISVSYDMRIPHRGAYLVGPAWLRCTGTFGLVERQKPVGSPTSLKVMPESAVSDEGLRKHKLSDAKLLDQWSKSKFRGRGTEFESISQFREGDDPRRIDWRTTARHQKLMVRHYEVEQHRDVIVLIDCGRLMGTKTAAGTKLDCAVNSAIMLSHVALAKGDRCGVGAFDDRVRGFLPPQSGKGYFDAIVASLCDIDSKWRETDFAQMFALLQARHRKRSLVIVLSDIVDADTSETLRQSLVQLRNQHVVLFVALQTPLLQESIQAPINSSLDATKKAVVFRLCQEREAALNAVRQSGIFVLDVTPSELTAPLVNHYIELREKNLL